MPQILANHYVLAVHNVRRSAEWYVRTLGFEIVNQPEGWIFVKRDNCMIMLGECIGDREAHELRNHSYFAYFRVDDVDALFEQVKASGVQVAGAPKSQPWGMREFGLTSPDGHRMMIGQTIA